MSNLSQRFNNLSLYKKILLILSTTLLFVFFAFVVGIQLLSQYYARELYTSNAQSLNYVSSFVSARMETVESGVLPGSCPIPSFRRISPISWMLPPVSVMPRESRRYIRLSILIFLMTTISNPSVWYFLTTH